MRWSNRFRHLITAALLAVLAGWTAVDVSSGHWGRLAFVGVILVALVRVIVTLHRLPNEP